MLAFESILGETLDIKAARLFEDRMRKEIVDADLSEQFSAYPIRLQSEASYRDHDMLDTRAFEEQAPLQRAAANPVTMPLEEEYPQLQLAGVAFIDGKLAVGTYIETPGSKAGSIETKASHYICKTVHIAELKDSRTGAVYRAEGYAGIGGPDPKLSVAYSILTAVRLDRKLKYARHTEGNIYQLESIGTPFVFVYFTLAALVSGT